MFSKPKIYYNNALRTAQEGDDGTTYATCPNALEYPLDRNKLLGAITPIADISALSQLVGTVIKFTTTGNKYRVTAIPTYPGLPSSSNWSSIAWNGSVFCAVSYTGTAAATSPDGITWTARTLPSSANWTAIAWNSTVFCIVANTNTVAAISQDGITWPRQILSLFERLQDADVGDSFSIRA